MKLISYISVIDADTFVHIINNNKTIYYGQLRIAYSQIENNYLQNAKVNYVRLLNGVLLIETVID